MNTKLRAYELAIKKNSVFRWSKIDRNEPKLTKNVGFASINNRTKIKHKQSTFCIIQHKRHNLRGPSRCQTDAKILDQDDIERDVISSAISLA